MVSNVIIYSTYAVIAFWLFADMLIEGFKRINPFLMNGQPSASIISVCWAEFRKTAIFHVRPAFVFWGASHPVTLVCRMLILNASATSDATALQIARGCNSNIFARASAFPIINTLSRWLQFVSRKGLNGQSIKRHAGQILKSWIGWHVAVYNFFSHFLTPSKLVVRGGLHQQPVPLF